MANRIHTFVYHQSLEEVTDFLIEWASREDSQVKINLRKLYSSDVPFIHPTARTIEQAPGVWHISFFDGRLPIELIERETGIVLYPGEMVWADPVICAQLTRIPGKKVIIILDCIAEEFVELYRTLLGLFGEIPRSESIGADELLAPEHLLANLKGPRGSALWWKSYFDWETDYRRLNKWTNRRGYDLLGYSKSEYDRQKALYKAEYGAK